MGMFETVILILGLGDRRAGARLAMIAGLCAIPAWLAIAAIVAATP